MIIEAPVRFHHVGNLSARAVKSDPRKRTFSEQEVIVDLQRCEVVKPAAAMWCLVYLLLAKLRGSSCKVLAPGQAAASNCLDSIQLFRVLESAGIEVRATSALKRQAEGSVLPLTRFDDEGQAERTTDEVLDALVESRLGAANLRPLVSENFAELALNAVQHSHSPVGAYGFVQSVGPDRSRSIVFGIADGGIGIRRSLDGNPGLQGKYSHDWDAIELATRERVTGTAGRTRGIGLYGFAEDMRKRGRRLIINSGTGAMRITDDSQMGARRTRLFPGTSVVVSVPA